MSIDENAGQSRAQIPHATHLERKRVLWLSLTAALAAVALAVFWLTPGHGWGDDFAGYLLQAKALVNATPDQELELNAHLMAASDWRYGPDAYPWGYPAILALVIWAAGQSLAVLKIVSVSSIGLATLAAGLLAYASRLGIRAAIAVAILVGMQPDLASLGNVIGSDAVFLALTAVALLFATVALGVWPQSSPAARRWAAVAAAVLGSLSYSVRSNGAVTLLAIAGSLVAVPLFAERRSARSVAASAAPFLLVCAALIITYYALLPDGSLGVASLLTVEPASLARRSSETVEAFGRFFPLFVLPQPLEQLAVAGVLVLAVLGAFRLGRAGFLLALYSVGHLLLLILFPFKGGQRYDLPVLLAVAVLTMGGIEVVARWSAAKVPRLRGLEVAGGAIVAALFVGAIAANVYRMDLLAPKAVDGPYSPAASELFGYVRAQPSTIQPVAFFKPRAMRFLAGKDAVMIRTLDSARHVNSIVLSRDEQAAQWQLSEAQVAALQDFRPAFRNEDFTLYVRAPAATAGVTGPK
jgi:hypothetical protein